jgi:hypothetical protein
MWLINELKPDFKTIADFRKNNKQQIKSAFLKFSMICSELGLVGKTIVAVDGSKFRASNSRAKYHSAKKIDDKIKHHSEQAEKYMKLLDACDSNEKSQPKLKKEEIIEKLDKINTRLSELESLKEKVAENGTIYETDPDSRMMWTNNNGADICHNVQIAVDSENHIVVAVDVTSQAVDKEQFHNISLQAKENLQVDEITSLADKGYYSALQFEKCAEDNIIPIVPKANHKKNCVTQEYSTGSFEYDSKKGGYICPQGALLLPYNATWKKSEELVYSNFDACKRCSERDKCTENKDGRKIHERHIGKYAREVDVRTKANPKMYHLRKQLVEHPFGTVKRALGFTYFLTRGNENVRTESLLHFLVYNLKRAINIVGTRGIIRELQA